MPRPLRRFAFVLPAVILALAPILFVACSDGGGWGSRREKTALSGLWVAPSSEKLTSSTTARLKDGGIAELYVVAATLESTGDFRPVDLPESLPPSTPLELVIAGELGTRDSDRAAEIGRSVAEAARQRRFDIESQGRLVVGLHFDLLEVADFEAYAAFLDAVRDGSDDLFVSATLVRDWLDREEVRAVARAVDYVVPFLYGQRIREPEAADAWDFEVIQRRLRALEEWDVPYQVGVVLLGTASLRGSNNALKARTTRVSMQDVLWNENLKLQPGFTLEGANRRVYTLAADRAVAVRDWKLVPGETLRVIRLATSDLEELLGLLEEWDLENHLGQLYYRLPAEDELLSIHAESLLSALDQTPASPDLEMTVSVQRRTGRGWLMRFGLANRNAEFTELSMLENNYLLIELADGHFEDKIAVGDFYRYELYDRTESGELDRTFRDPSVMRISVPILEGSQRVSTGDIEVVVRGRGEPRLVMSAKFLLPDGRTLELGPRVWSAGGFEDERDSEEPEEPAADVG